MKFSPYIAFAKKSFLQKSAYRLDHWMGILNTMIRLFIFVEIYRALYDGRDSINGIRTCAVSSGVCLLAKKH